MLKLGMVDLCTSHPGSWMKIINEMDDVEVAAVHDSGGVRPDGYAAQFAEEENIEIVCDTIEEMVGVVDGALIHSANWDIHVAHAMPFIEAGVPVFLDKPMVGNLPELHELLRLDAKYDGLIMGGSSVRWAVEVQELAGMREEMGEIGTVWVQGRGDFFNYGIHTVECFQGLMGTGVISVEHVGDKGGMDVFRADYADGTPVFYVLGSPASPWFVSVSAANGVYSRPLGSNIYPALIDQIVKAFSAGEPPMSLEDNLECIKVALAAKVSRREGTICYLQDLDNDESFDGFAFAEEYAKARQ